MAKYQEHTQPPSSVLLIRSHFQIHLLKMQFGSVSGGNIFWFILFLVQNKVKEARRQCPYFWGGGGGWAGNKGREGCDR